MDEGFCDILDKFTKDMQKSGVFVAPPMKNSWEDPSFNYAVRVGLHRYLSSDIPNHGYVYEKGEVLPNNEGYLMSDLEGTTCLIGFMGDRSTEQERKNNDYLLTLPGHIENSATSLQGMVDGVRLLNTLDSWGYSNGILIKTKIGLEDSRRAISKKFRLNLKQK